jgi:hypothetical protein
LQCRVSFNSIVVISFVSPFQSFLEWLIDEDHWLIDCYHNEQSLPWLWFHQWNQCWIVSLSTSILEWVLNLMDSWETDHRSEKAYSGPTGQGSKTPHCIDPA